MREIMDRRTNHFLPIRMTAILALILAAAGGLLAAFGINWMGARQAAAASIPIEVAPLTQFAADSYPTGLVYGPENAFWFTLSGANAIGRYAPSATTNTLSLPTPQARPTDLVIGSGQELWFTETGVGQIGHLDLSTNQFQEFGLDNASSYPTQIVLGQDGAFWFTEFEGNQIGRMMSDGTLTHYPLPHPASLPLGIVSAPNGDLWLTEWGGYKIARLTPAGSLVEFEIPGVLFKPSAITVGPDGAIWFTYELGKSISRIDPETEIIQTFDLPTSSTSLLDITTGPDGRLWFLGVASVGHFEADVNGPANLTETQIPTIFESEGRSQIISGPEAEMVFITGNSSRVFTATVPGGASWRDLQIFIRDLPPALLAGGVFTVTAEIHNWSSSTANDVQFVLPLDDDIQFQQLVTPSGGVGCNPVGQTTTCPLGTMPSSSTLPLTITLQADRMSSYPTTRRIDMYITLQESDFQPANNRTYRDLRVTATLEYFNDFTLGSDAHWSPTQTHQTASGLSYLGLFDEDLVKFNWENLPPHDQVNACFDWYILGEWDGSTTVEPQGLSPLSNFIGPDLWSYYLDQEQILVSSFSNREDFEQSFPSDYNSGSHPARQNAYAVGDFDDLPLTTDAQYRLCHTVVHTAKNLNLTFLGQNMNEQADEKWAIDNVYLKVYYRGAFDFLHIPLVFTEGE